VAESRPPSDSKKQWGSRAGGARRRGRSLKAIAAKTIASWSTSAWRCGLSHQMVVAEIGRS